MKLFKGKNTRKISIIVMSAIMIVAACFGVVTSFGNAHEVSAESAISAGGWASYHGQTSVQFSDYIIHYLVSVVKFLFLTIYSISCLKNQTV